MMDCKEHFEPEIRTQKRRRKFACVVMASIVHGQSRIHQNRREKKKKHRWNTRWISFSCILNRECNRNETQKKNNKKKRQRGKAKVGWKDSQYPKEFRFFRFFRILECISAERWKHPSDWLLAKCKRLLIDSATEEAAAAAVTVVAVVVVIVVVVAAGRKNFWVEVTYTHRAKWDQVRFACRRHRQLPLASCCRRAIRDQQRRKCPPRAGTSATSARPRQPTPENQAERPS